MTDQIAKTCLRCGGGAIGPIWARQHASWWRENISCRRLTLPVVKPPTVGPKGRSGGSDACVENPPNHPRAGLRRPRFTFDAVVRDTLPNAPTIDAKVGEMVAADRELRASLPPAPEGKRWDRQTSWPPIGTAFDEDLTIKIRYRLVDA